MWSGGLARCKAHLVPMHICCLWKDLLHAGGGGVRMCVWYLCVSLLLHRGGACALFHLA